MAVCGWVVSAGDYSDVCVCVCVCVCCALLVGVIGLVLEEKCVFIVDVLFICILGSHLPFTPPTIHSTSCFFIFSDLWLLIFVEKKYTLRMGENLAWDE